MTRIKITAIGAASFVFGPSLLAQLIMDHRLDDLDLALMDVDAPGVQRMAQLGRTMARHAGVQARITAYTNRTEAMDGADFLVVCAAPQHIQRFTRDIAIMDQYLPGQFPTQFTGITGLGYALRQMAFFDTLIDDLKQHCPNAVLVNLSNPLSQLALLSHRRGVRTIGCCSATLEAYSHIWQLLGHSDQPIDYPYTPAAERYEPTIAGVNHFCWLTRIIDKQTGDDCTTALTEALNRRVDFGQPLSLAASQTAQALLLPNDHHVVDFLKTNTATMPHRAAYGHGDPAERQQRIDLMDAVIAETAPIDALLSTPAWERPGDLIAAMACNRPCHCHSLNLINNRQQLPGLPEDIFVETPCRVDANGPEPITVTLHDIPLALCRRAAAVTTAMVDAFAAGQRSALKPVLELDPTLTDFHAGWSAVENLLQAHQDILYPRFAS